MELVVFDLDGTLLNRESEISDYTSETLRLLSERDIAYTVATGRTLHGAGRSRRTRVPVAAGLQERGHDLAPGIRAFLIKRHVDARRAG